MHVRKPLFRHAAFALRIKLLIALRLFTRCLRCIYGRQLCRKRERCAHSYKYRDDRKFEFEVTVGG